MTRPSPYTQSMNRLIAQLATLPGIGRRSAERLAFHLLKAPADEAVALGQSIIDMRRSTGHCSVCFNITDADPCSICCDPNRDRSLVLVVEQPKDVLSLESTGAFPGVYHVLMGRLSPLENVGPDELNVAPLLERVREGNPGGDGSNTPVREVVLGMNPTVEGDGTALYLTERLGALGVKVSRLARGLPSGGSLELLSKAVLSDAIHGRQSVHDSPAGG